MAEARIELKVGAVSFSGEGTEKWVSSELDKVIAKLPELAAITPAEPRSNGSEPSVNDNGPALTAKKSKGGTLAAFLKDKKATTNQTRKFLAAALWLQDGGKDMLTTQDVTKALGDAKQGALTNPSQCLANNVSQGFCDKNGKKQFYVTDDGRAELA
jgi:hypothetical protein